MTQTFTPNDIIRYIYRETSEEETLEIDNALLCDSALLDVFLELDAIKVQLNSAMKAPSDHVINNIFRYSRSLDVAT